MSRPPRSPSLRPPRSPLLPPHPPSPQQPQSLNNTSSVNIDVEEDCEILENDDLQACIKEEDEPPKKKGRGHTSDCWNYFDRLPIPESGRERCICKGCKQEYGCASRGGTTHLNRHVLTCGKCEKPENDLSRKLYDKVVRDLIAQMIVLHNLPFQCVEWRGFRAYSHYISFGEINTVSRNTITGDVMKVYLHEKEKLKNQLARHNGRVCLTSDCWTSCTTRGYMTLTAHFIDEDWKLNSKLLSFCHLEPPHTGHELSRKMLELLKEWGIEKKVFSVTLDNASNNDSMQNIMKSQLCLSKSLLCNGDFFHIRCCAHILNLIVQDGLRAAFDALLKIRKSITYVRNSESRMKLFDQCVEEVGDIDSSVGLRTDCPTRWNSSFLMLESALRYSRAFECLSLKDENYKHCPTNEEWERGRKICEFLEPFNEITNMFSGSKYPTSNLYFMQIWKIEVLLKDNRLSEDVVIKDMTSKMVEKFDKYWNEYSLILAFGCVLDPRMKFQFLKYAYSRLYANDLIVDDKLGIVKNSLYKLFNEYVNNVEATPIDSHPSNPTSKTNTNWSKEYDAFEEHQMKETTFIGKSELDLYLAEPKLVGHKDLDVLEYWRGLSQQHGNLGRMARDILSIPITTVASESTFSIGGRILNKYRNSLLSTNLEALICTRNWLLGFSQDDEFDSIDVAIDGANERTSQVEDKNHPNIIILDDQEL